MPAQPCPPNVSLHESGLRRQVPRCPAVHLGYPSPARRALRGRIRRATPLLPLSIGWREGWGERPRATLLPAGLLPLSHPMGEGRGEGPSFLRPVVLTRGAPVLGCLKNFASIHGQHVVSDL